MDVPTSSSDLTLIADEGELRIIGPQQVCFPLEEYLESKGLATGVMKIINQGTNNLHSTVKFEVEGKTGDEVKELIEAFLSGRKIRARCTTVRNPPHGFETVFHLVDVSVFRPN
jgi:hypothetical protein